MSGVWLLESRRIGTEEWEVDMRSTPRSVPTGWIKGLFEKEEWARFEFRVRRYVRVDGPPPPVTVGPPEPPRPPKDRGVSGGEMSVQTYGPDLTSYGEYKGMKAGESDGYRSWVREEDYAALKDAADALFKAAEKYCPPCYEVDAARVRYKELSK